MDQPSPYYSRSLDVEALLEEFPVGAEYMERIHFLSPDRLRTLQEHRFLQQIARGWEVPFYERLWSRAGLTPGDIRSLDDLRHLPSYDVNDLRESIERSPPWGDYLGIDPRTSPPTPMVFHTSGGTTGLPRPMIYTPRDREVMTINSARRLYMGGVRPFDIAQVTFALGLPNAGMQTREGLWKYTGAVPVVTGSGATTPTRRQIELMRAWKVNVLFGFPPYLRHMAEVAKADLGFDVAELGLKAIFSHLGVDSRQVLETLWGTRVYDSYGTNECGTITADCAHRDGMHIFSDSFVIEILDPGTMRPCEPGEKGTMFVTSLFKHAAPVIRFNSNDVSAFSKGSCACGGTHPRLECIFGRSDNMVKLRGVNVFPEAVGAVVAEHPQSNGEYVCIVEKTDRDREEMTVMVEARNEADRAALGKALADRLRETLGVKILVEVVAAGATDTHTGLSQTSKIKRLIDRRKKRS